LRRRWRSLPKVVAIVGGFSILMGVVLLGIAVLAFFGYLNVGILLERRYLLPFAFSIITVGLLDTFVAAIVGRW